MLISKIRSTFYGLQRVLKKSRKLYIFVPNLDVVAQIYLQAAEGQNKYHAMRFIYEGQIKVMISIILVIGQIFYSQYWGMQNSKGMSG